MQLVIAMMQLNEQYRAKVEAVLSRLPALLTQYAQTVPVDISALIQTHFNVGSAEHNPLNATWSTSDQLNNFKYLANSFLPGNPGSLTSTQVSADGVVVNIGSALPYAQIQETGGFVGSKGSMEKYFWAMYYQSDKKNEFFKIMALSVMKKHGITIPARPYLQPALDEYEKLRAQEAINELIDEIMEIF